MRCPVRNPGSLGHRCQRLIPLEVWLEQTEALHSQPARLFRQSGELVHTGTVCQIMLTTLCQLILKVSLIRSPSRVVSRMITSFAIHELLASSVASSWQLKPTDTRAEFVPEF